MKRLFALGILSVFAVALAGCGGASGSIAKTTGRVTYNDVAVEGATVNMAREDGSLFATGITDAQGNFTMSTKYGKKNYDGAPIGKVVISITKFADLGGGDNYDPDADPTAVDKMMSQMIDKYGQENEGGIDISTESQIPAKYGVPQTSGLTETIDADPTKNVFTFDLVD